MPRRKPWQCPPVQHQEVKTRIEAIVKEWEKRDGKLTPSDYEQMNQAAKLLDIVYMSNESISMYGLSQQCDNGSRTQNPDVKAGRDAWDRYLVIMKECGLTKKSKKALKDPNDGAELTEFQKAFICG